MCMLRGVDSTVDEMPCCWLDKQSSPFRLCRCFASEPPSSLDFIELQLQIHYLLSLSSSFHRLLALCK